MNKEKQRIAIAEACGWRLVPAKEPRNFADAWIQGDTDAPTKVVHRLPDYLHDLNAMHEAEKVLMEKQRNQYASMLHIHGTCDYEKQTWHDWIHATAAQRAEAFLRTIGKWEKSS